MHRLCRGQPWQEAAEVKGCEGMFPLLSERNEEEEVRSKLQSIGTLVPKLSNEEGAIPITNFVNLVCTRKKLSFYVNGQARFIDAFFFFSSYFSLILNSTPSRAYTRAIYCCLCDICAATAFTLWFVPYLYLHDRRKSSS